MTLQTSNTVKVDVRIDTQRVSVSQSLLVFDFPQIGRRASSPLSWVGSMCLGRIEETETGGCKCRSWCHSHHTSNGLWTLHILIVAAVRIDAASRAKPFRTTKDRRQPSSAAKRPISRE